MTKATEKHQARTEKKEHSQVVIDNYVAGFDGLLYQERINKVERELLDAVNVGLIAARAMAANQQLQPDWLGEIEAIVLREKARTYQQKNELN